MKITIESEGKKRVIEGKALNAKFYLLYAGEKFYYYDTVGKYVIEMEHGKRPDGKGPYGRILPVQKAREILQLELAKGNDGKFTRNGFRLLNGKEPDRKAM